MEAVLEADPRLKTTLPSLPSREFVMSKISCQTAGFYSNESHPTCFVSVTLKQQSYQHYFSKKSNKSNTFPNTSFTREVSCPPITKLMPLRAKPSMSGIRCFPSDQL